MRLRIIILSLFERTLERILKEESHRVMGFVTYPKLKSHFVPKKTLCFIFIVMFMIIDQVGSSMIVIKYPDYFIKLINKR